MGKWFAFGFAVVPLNVFALAATSDEYVAGAIRRTHDLLWVVFGRPGSLQRSYDAEVRAGRWARWGRPLALVLVNGVSVWILWETLRR